MQIRRNQNRTLVPAVLVALLGAVLFARAGFADLQTEKVIIVVIDGVRASEFLEEPNHPHIPRIWNELRPQSYVSHGFYNIGSTLTVGGHATMGSGTLQDLPDDGSVRPDRPLIWEYLREQNALPEDAAVLVGRKGKLHAISYSTFPGYGSADSAHVIAPTAGDPSSLQWFFWFAFQHHPTISLVSFGAPDVEAHAGLWDNYLNAIEVADSLTAALWNWTETVPAYAGKTTLFITCDHGRHLVDWCNHGDACAGCRHLPFVAIGPDFKHGVETTSPGGDLRDIAVTAAWLLGIDTPYATGRLMRELLADPSAIPSSGAFARPRLLVSPSPAVGAVRIRLDAAPGGGAIGGARPASASGIWTAALLDAAGRMLWRSSISGSELDSGFTLAPPAEGTGMFWLVLRPQGSPGVPDLSSPVLWVR